MMKHWKPLIYFLILNVLVSALTTLAVLIVWERLHPTPAPALAQNPSLSSPTIFPTAPLNATPNIALEESSTTPTEAVDTPIPENVQEYQVQFGETLGLIAEKFDTTIEELMRINQIKDPDSLSAGMVVYVPLPADQIPTPTIQPSATPAPATVGTPASSPQALRVIINSVIGVGELASEHVFITRSGDGDLSLEGWKLEDEDGNVFIFPKLELFKDGGVNVWTTSGAPTVVDLYWGMAAPVWRAGEKVTLRDAQGTVRATYLIP